MNPPPSPMTISGREWNKPHALTTMLISTAPNISSQGGLRESTVLCVCLLLLAPITPQQRLSRRWQGSEEGGHKSSYQWCEKMLLRQPGSSWTFVRRQSLAGRRRVDFQRYCLSMASQCPLKLHDGPWWSFMLLEKKNEAWLAPLRRWAKDQERACTLGVLDDGDLFIVLGDLSVVLLVALLVHVEVLIIREEAERSRGPVLWLIV